MSFKKSTACLVKYFSLCFHESFFLYDPESSMKVQDIWSLRTRVTKLRCSRGTSLFFSRGGYYLKKNLRAACLHMNLGLKDFYDYTQNVWRTVVYSNVPSFSLSCPNPIQLLHYLQKTISFKSWQHRNARNYFEFVEIQYTIL